MKKPLLAVWANCEAFLVCRTASPPRSAAYTLDTTLFFNRLHDRFLCLTHPKFAGGHYSEVPFPCPFYFFSWLPPLPPSRRAASHIALSCDVPCLLYFAVRNGSCFFSIYQSDSLLCPKNSLPILRISSVTFYSFHHEIKPRRPPLFDFTSFSLLYLYFTKARRLLSFYFLSLLEHGNSFLYSFCVLSLVLQCSATIPVYFPSIPLLPRCPLPPTSSLFRGKNLFSVARAIRPDKLASPDGSKPSSAPCRDPLFIRNPHSLSASDPTKHFFLCPADDLSLSLEAPAFFYLILRLASHQLFPLSAKIPYDRPANVFSALCDLRSYLGFCRQIRPSSQASRSPSFGDQMVSFALVCFPPGPMCF